MEAWEKEITIYNERLDKIGQWFPDLSNFRGKIPHIPLSYEPSEEGLVALQASLYIYIGCMPFANQAVQSFIMLWRSGIFTTISLPVRLIYELWGASNYCLNVFLKAIDSDDWAVASSKIQRLMLGARSEVPLPWGGNTVEKSIHVMDFIRSLSPIESEAERIYDFLCESCHPSYLRLTIWSLAAPPIQNWENERFRKHVHEILDATLSALEKALRGISISTVKILESALPYIESDQKKT